MLSELLSLCDISVTTWCYIYHCLHSKHILMEIGGLITFTHNQVCVCMFFLANCDYFNPYKQIHAHAHTHTYIHTHTHTRISSCCQDDHADPVKLRVPEH